MSIDVTETTLIINDWDHIGSILKKERIEQGKTRQEIVDACDISLNTIGLVENNKVKPTLPTLHQWVKVLGYTNLCIRFQYINGDEDGKTGS